MKSKLLLAFILIYLKGIGQQVIDPKTDGFIERKIETIAENASEDIDFTTVFEALNYYKEQYKKNHE